MNRLSLEPSDVYGTHLTTRITNMVWANHYMASSQKRWGLFFLRS
jgi:hypothetical protein